MEIEFIFDAEEDLKLAIWSHCYTEYGPDVCISSSSLPGYSLLLLSDR